MPRSRKAPTGKKVEFEQNDSAPVFYVNSTGIRVSQWDFLFQMGTIAAMSSDGIKVKEGLRVYMSPQHTKAFLELLAKQVKIYEEQFNTIAVKSPGELKIITK